jgi:cold shock CspA family protein
METKLVGRIYSFIHTRGFGFIISPSGNSRTPAKYFLHISQIISGADKVAVGATVRFSVNPISEGTLPAAVDAEITDGGAV